MDVLYWAKNRFFIANVNSRHSRIRFYQLSPLSKIDLNDARVNSAFTGCIAETFHTWTRSTWLYYPSSRAGQCHDWTWESKWVWCSPGQKLILKEYFLLTRIAGSPWARSWNSFYRLPSGGCTKSEDVGIQQHYHLKISAAMWSTTNYGGDNICNTRSDYRWSRSWGRSRFRVEGKNIWWKSFEHGDDDSQFKVHIKNHSIFSK